MQIPDNIYEAGHQDRRKNKRLLSLHWRQKWRQWMDSRIPAAREITLNRHNVFIFPTSAGFGFLGFIGILLLVAINFENSQVYALCFTLCGLIAVSILHTFSNLSGVQLSANHAEPAFAGRDAVFTITLKKTNRRYFGLQLSWQDKCSEWVDLNQQSEQRVTLRYRTGLRGICHPGRVKIETRYPLGIIRAWTWVDLQMQTLVFPYPIGDDQLPTTGVYQHQDGALEQSGSDDFYSLRAYQSGDSMRSIAWKQYAKTEKLSTKQFVDYFDQRMWLSWEQTDGDTERRLSQLCHWALEAESGSNEYGLSLPGKDIAPGRGKQHLETVLSALALYQRGTDRPETVVLDNAKDEAINGVANAGPSRANVA